MIRAYLRVSTDKQGDSGLGLEAQRRAISDKYPGEAIEWYTDEVSGSTPALERPAFGRLINEAEAGDTIAVAKLDRLSRSLSDYCAIDYLLQREKLELVSVNGDGTGMGNDPMGELFRGFIVLIAQYERRLTQLRTKAAMQALKANGFHASRVSPLATVVDRRQRRDGTLGAGKLCINTELLEKLRKLKASGRGWPHLAEVAAADLGKPVTPSSVRHALGKYA